MTTAPDTHAVWLQMHTARREVERLKTALMDSTRSRGILPHVEIAHAHLEMALDVLREDEED